MAVDQVILDGEVDWGDGNLKYHIFDILWLNGRDLMPLPLMERRAILHHLGLRRPLRPVPEITGDKPWERACLDGWEGVIAKRRDSPYEHRRSPHWRRSSWDDGRARAHRRQNTKNCSRQPVSATGSCTLDFAPTWHHALPPIHPSKQVAR
ncbi:MAG: hypothetical protein ACR2JB_17955 [Bryobacteraceae bacterium]